MSKETMERARGIFHVISHLVNKNYESELNVDCAFIRIGYLVEAGKLLMRQSEIIDHLNDKVELPIAEKAERKEDVISQS